MAQRRGKLAIALGSPARSSRLLLFAAVLAFVLIGLRLGSVLAGRSGRADRMLVGATAPAVRGVRDSAEGVGGLGAMFRAPALHDENSRLVEENANLANRISELEGLRDENAQLRTQLKLKPYAELRPVHATVIARPFDPWLESAVLGVGTESGIQPGCVVTSGGALVGKVSEAAQGFSRVELLSSPRFRIAAIANPGGYEGIVRGISGSELALDYLLAGAKVEIQGKVFTRGSETVPPGVGFDGSPATPRGIPIGQIVEKSTAQGFLQLRLKPSADVNRLNSVTVYVP